MPLVDEVAKKDLQAAAEEAMVSFSRILLPTGQGAGPLETAYAAGKLMAGSTPDKVNRMGEKQLREALRAVELGVRDRSVMDVLAARAASSAESIMDRWRGQIRTAVDGANSQWRGLLEGGLLSDSALDAARAGAREELGEAITSTILRTQNALDTLLQTQVAQFQLEGQTSEEDDEAIVYKVPRPTAEKHCVRLHVNPDGSYIEYRLGDVRGNTNEGLPAYAWEFTVGPVHPHCYCVLYRADQRRNSASPTRAAVREYLLEKSAASGDCSGHGPPPLSALRSLLQAKPARVDRRSGGKVGRPWQGSRADGYGLDIGERLSTVEANYQTLAGEVHSLGRRIDQSAQDTRSAIKDLGDRFSDSRRTPWSALAGWASVLVVLAGFGFAALSKLDDRLDEHLQQPGHTASMENQRSLRELVMSNDEKVNARIDRQFLEMKESNGKLDTALQREMRDLNAADQRYSEQIEKRLERLENLNYRVGSGFHSETRRP